jgi:hypothetical protein
VINELISKANYVIIVCFRFIQRLEKPIKRKELIRERFEPNHRDVRQLPEFVYRNLIKPRTSLYGVSYEDSSAEVKRKFKGKLEAEARGRLGVAFKWNGISDASKSQQVGRRQIILLLLFVVAVLVFLWSIVW